MSLNWLTASKGILETLSGLSSVYSAYNSENSFADYKSLMIQSAMDNYASQANALSTRYNQLQEESSNELMDSYLENLQGKATAEASAASSGVSGVSLDAMFQGYDRANAVNKYTAARNLKLQGLQYDNELDSLRVQAMNTIYGTGYYQGESSLTALTKTLSGITNLIPVTGTTTDTTKKTTQTKPRTYGMRADTGAYKYIS